MAAGEPVPTRQNCLVAYLHKLCFMSVVTLVLLALSASRPAPAEELPPQARDALQKGNEAVQQRQWLLADQQFKIAVEAAGSDPEVMLALARFSEQKGGRDLIAIAWYRAYLPTRTEAKEREQITARIAALEQRVGNTSKNILEKALSAASNVPTNDRASVLSNIAVVQAKTGDLSGALATASNARTVAGANSYGSDPYGNVAEGLVSIGNFAAADDVLRRVEQSKRSSTLRSMATTTLSYTKRVPEALAYAAQTSGSDRISAYSYIAKAQAEAGDKSGALSSLNSAIQAVNYLEQSSRRGSLLNMVEYAAEAGEFETARRLYADGSKLFNPNDSNNSYYLNSARWHLAEGLAKWGRVTEAEALLPTVFANNKNPSFAWYRPHLIGAIQQARQRQAESLKAKYQALVKEGKIAEADTALSREPATLAAAAGRVSLASIYLAKGDTAAARRHLEPAAVALSKATVADFSNAFQFTLSRIEIADLYRSMADIAASKRVLDATVGTIAKLANPDARRSPIEYLCDAYVRLASTIAATKNFAAAKSIAMEVFKLSTQVAAGDRASVLAKVSGLDPQVGLINELAAAVPSLPAGYSKQTILTNLVKVYVSAGQEAAALAMARQIEDASTRASALKSGIERRALEKNWTAAIALASDPVLSGRLYPDVAYRMLAAGLVQDAISLEPKFTSASDEAYTYYTSLAQHHAARANTEAALAAAMRISSLPRRISALFSIRSSIEATAGRAAARTVRERATAQFAELKAPIERSETCNLIKAYITIIDDEAPAKTANQAPETACVAEALAIPAQKDRLSPLGSALAYPTMTTRPLISGTLAPTRPAVSRLLTEASGLSSQSSRDSNMSTALNTLAREGAIETAMELAADNINDGYYSPANAAVTWLVEIGDTATAQKLLNRAVDAIPALTSDSEKDSAYSRAAALATLLGDFDRAIKLTSEMKSPSNRVSSFVSIANAANTKKRFDVALNTLDRALAADKEADSHYYKSSFYSIAATAGHKKVETFLDDYLTDKSLSTLSRVSARYTAMSALLNWKQYDRVTALVPAQEVEIAQLAPVATRWSYASTLATALATLGDTVRLNKLFADAPLPENKVQILLSAAAGFVKADKADNARPAIERSVELSAAIADVGTRSSTLQSIASYQVQIGNIDAARKTLLQSLEVLKVNRPDLAGWADFMIASSLEGNDPEQAARLALAITEPFWRTSAIVRLANTRLSAGRLPDAVKILRAGSPSALADSVLEVAARRLAGKSDLETARELAGRISHAGIRDRVRRQLALTQVRSGAIAAALAETSTIEDKAIRAYAFLDLGAFLLTQKYDKDSPNAYFAQLSYFAAAQLADQISDTLTKADILADAGHGQNKWQAGAGTATLTRASAAAAEIADAQARRYATQWGRGLGVVKKPDPLVREERDTFTSKVRYMSEDRFIDLDAHIESFATNNPTDRISKLTTIATSFAEQLQDMRKTAANFEQKRKVGQ